MADGSAHITPADLQVVLDLRGSENAWSANVCGLSVALRALLTARHAGVKSAVLVGPQAESVKSAALAHPYAGLSIDCSEEMPIASEMPRLIFAVPLVLSTDAIKTLAKDASPEGLSLPAQVDAASLDFLAPARDARGRRLAGRKIRNSCRKPVEYSGIMSVLFKQAIVLQMTRVVSRLPITPNAITVLSLLIGMLAIPFYLEASHASVAIAGAILFVNNLFDILDGQIARMKFRFSDFGERLDNLADGTLNVLILAPIGIGLQQSTGLVLWEILGWVGSMGSLSYLLMVEYYSWKKGLSGYSTNMQFFYRLDKKGNPKSAPVVAAPKTGIRRYLAPKYFMRKDFLFTMFLVFGLLDMHMIPFCLMVAGSLEYGVISWVQVLFFHDRIRFASTHRGSV